MADRPVQLTMTFMRSTPHRSTGGHAVHTTYTNAAIADQRRADYEARATQHRQARLHRQARQAQSPSVRSTRSDRRSVRPAGETHRSWPARIVGAMTSIRTIRRPAHA